MTDRQRTRWFMLLIPVFLSLGLIVSACSSDDEVTSTHEPDPESESASNNAADEPRGLLHDLPQTAPEIELTDHEGNPFRLSDHQGRVVAMFFGYTHCPDICPLTLMHMQDATLELGEDARDALFLFITVDPEQDTPEQMARYVGRVETEVIGLTGDREELERVWEAYDITVEIEPRDDDSYLISHSAQIWVLNQQGQAVMVLPPNADGVDMAHDIRWLLDRPS